jgi:hypothetical protein
MIEQQKCTCPDLSRAGSRERSRRKRGAPVGNQNARKHGYYARVITDEDKRNLKRAATVKGIGQEIDLLRVKLKSILQHDPDNIKLLLQAIVSLARLLRTRKSIGEDTEEKSYIAFQNILRDLILPMFSAPARFPMNNKTDHAAPGT